ncbi:MAG: TlpA disulfide reductase family protein, partial [Oscillospiraceae bacterium]
NKTRQNIALISVAVLMIVAIFTGLVKPYLKNQGEKPITQGSQSTSGGDDAVAVTNFKFTDKDDNTINFDDLKGKPIVINFWATWCGFCVKEMPDFNKLAKEYSGDVNFIILDVVDGKRETKEKGLAFLQDNKYDDITPYFDSFGEGCSLFGISSFPTTVYIDKDGNLYDATIGLTSYDAAKAVIDKMLEE